MKLEEILIPKVQEAVKNLYGIEITPAQVQFQKTRAEFEGDITLVVFPFVKAARKAPAVVAQEVGEKLLEQGTKNQEQGLIEKYNAVQGFLNLCIAQSYWIEQLQLGRSRRVGWLASASDTTCRVVLNVVDGFLLRRGKCFLSRRCQLAKRMLWCGKDRDTHYGCQHTCQYMFHKTNYYRLFDFSSHEVIYLAISEDDYLIVLEDFACVIYPIRRNILYCSSIGSIVDDMNRDVIRVDRIDFEIEGVVVVFGNFDSTSDHEVERNLYLEHIVESSVEGW